MKKNIINNKLFMFDGWIDWFAYQGIRGGELHHVKTNLSKVNFGVTDNMIWWNKA